MRKQNRRLHVTVWTVVLTTAGAGMLVPALRSLRAETPPATQGRALAEVDGKPVSREEVEEAAARDLDRVDLQRQQCEMRATQQKHQVLESTVERMVRERMFDAEAEAQGVSRQEYLDAELARRGEGVSDEAVDAWYEKNKGRIRQPKEQIAERIRQLLADQELVEELKGKYRVAYTIEPYRVDVEADGSPSQGPADAPVTLVEFSDFQCPYCRRVTPTLKRIRETYGEQVRLVFRHYPLDNHPNAQKAAEASLCAEDQGRFWEMHDLMFQDQKKLSVADLKDKAAVLELDSAEFNACLDSDKYAGKVREDFLDGVRAGVSGTPAMFINGRPISGAVPYEQIAEVVDEELAGAPESAAN